MFKFENLEIWKLSLDYVDLVYKLTKRLPKTEEYNLKSQMIRAATSVSLNIAEGSMGQTNSEQSRFLGMALRSLIETVACQFLIKRRQFPNMDNTFLSKAYKDSQILTKKIQAMRNAILPEKTWVRENDANYFTSDEA